MATSEKASNVQITGRVAVLETGLESLANTVKALANTVEKEATENRRTVEALGDKIAQSQKTPWGVLAAWASVIVAVGALLVASLSNEVDTVRLSEKETRIALNEKITDWAIWRENLVRELATYEEAQRWLEKLDLERSKRLEQKIDELIQRITLLDKVK